ncbi:hypothetical protein PHYBOEH_009681 [Phytophthora boehmeriae]|uniref:Centrosomin N-terminal motif 1 domain-containing protein n=1 Tax=Phytophthora boehmeriae TaxID=109152 RepID=A0A8T1X4X5_9STRA|nr:hypothetical protein PHYBOEH_009681 [Phytophthora boehmeriae]
MLQTPRRERDDGDGSGMSATPTPTRDNSTLLREQEAERERLRMDNFNQALRINFLEERLLRVKQGTDFSGEDLESELAQLRITLEERDHELRQRNFSMIRATEAIDLLTAQLHEAQAAAARARDEAQREAEAQVQQHLQQRGGVDAETAERWRLELETASQKEQQSAKKIQELEEEIKKQREAAEAMNLRMKEMQELRAREQTEVELRLQRDQQSLQQLEMNNVKLSTEAEHWKLVASQREEQNTALQMQLDTERQDKQKIEARSQAKMKSMEEQVKHQMEQVQRESENYRAEHTRLLTDCEKARFEKERIAMENESIKLERARLQAEIERLAKEMQQMAGDAKRVQLQNAKLSATCEEQSKSLDTFKSERESAMDTIHQLESELHQNRKQVAKYDMSIKTLESQLQYAEAEAKRMKQQCDLAESRCQQTSNERLLVLEKDRQAIEEDNRRLRAELAGFQQDLEAMERKFQESEERFSNEAANAQKQRQDLSVYQEELQQRSAKLREYQMQLEAYEDELAHRNSRVQELEQQVAKTQEYQAQLTTCENELARRAARVLELEQRVEKAKNFQTQFAASEGELAQRGARVLELEQQLAKALEFEKQLTACEDELVHRRTELEQQVAKANEYQAQLAACEDELARAGARVQDLERQLADVISASTSTNATVRHQQIEWQNQFATEKSEILRQLDDERQRCLELKNDTFSLKNEAASANRELEAIEIELRSLLRNRPHSFNDGRKQPMVSLLREAILTLKNDLKAEVEGLQNRWKQQASLMGSKLDRLATQLRASQSKLEVLQRSSFHAKDAKNSLDKTWSVRYEELRIEKEHERRELEEEIHFFQSKMEEALAEAKSNREALTRERKSSREKSHRSYDDLRESNRLLYEEIQERRKSAEHARKQYMQAIRENKELLKAIEIYKDGIASRNKDIEKYQARIVKLSQQLQHRASLGEVKQTLLGQLEQTQYMISETYKRWEDSPIARGPGSSGHETYEAAIVQLDEYIGRLQLVSDRWGEFMTHSQELQGRYSEAWKSASTRGFDRSKDQPRWVDDVERKCTRLLAEAVRISEAMRDIVDNIVRVVQRERDEKNRMEKERAFGTDNNASVKQREARSKWLPSSDFFDQNCDPYRTRSVSQPQFDSPVKSRALNGADPSMKAAPTARRNASELYRNSLSSLGRVGMKMQDLEKEIRTFHD